MTEQNTDHAQVKIHPPVLTLIHLIIAFALGWLIPLPIPLPTFTPILSIVLVLLGLAFAGSAVFQFRAKRTTVNPHGSVSMIVSDGPYRFSRNPIYVGLVCLLIGFPLIARSLWGLILSPVLILSFDNLVIQYEEAYLEKKFGEPYTNYKSRVRRWI